MFENKRKHQQPAIVWNWNTRHHVSWTLVASPIPTHISVTGLVAIIFYRDIYFREQVQGKFDQVRFQAF